MLLCRLLTFLAYLHNPLITSPITYPAYTCAKVTTNFFQKKIQLCSISILKFQKISKISENFRKLRKSFFKSFQKFQNIFLHIKLGAPLKIVGQVTHTLKIVWSILFLCFSNFTIYYLEF